MPGNKNNVFSGTIIYRGTDVTEVALTDPFHANRIPVHDKIRVLAGQRFYDFHRRRKYCQQRAFPAGATI
jgi:hypothetical protein